MIAVGVDVGSTTTKAVVLEEETVLRGAHIEPTGELPNRTALAVFHAALDKAGLRETDVDTIATTGYGRRLAGLGDLVMTEIKACAAGALFAVRPGAALHTVIDIGGQDTKVVALTDKGEIEDFSMNDKCAAGTGRFLEILAHKLGLSYEAFVAESLRSGTRIQMNATCAVFAESEVVGLLARGVSRADIASAAHAAIASRVGSMVRRVASKGSYAFVGGGALNRALAKALEEDLGEALCVPPDAQLVIALGAAIEAARRRRRPRDPGEK
ncbi:MAG: acyl-CoA dehydratase activase [Planctomycetota bacterium]